MDNFTRTIIFQETKPEKVYDALTNSIPHWWTEMFEGSSNQQGQLFTIRFGTNIYKSLVVEELVPNKKVVWYVTDSLIYIPELTNKAEWINTKIVWEISSKNEQTILDLTHFGLTPKVECFNICQDGWKNFTDSLTEFINTGIGNPFKL